MLFCLNLQSFHRPETDHCYHTVTFLCGHLVVHCLLSLNVLFKCAVWEIYFSVLQALDINSSMCTTLLKHTDHHQYG